MERQEFNLLKTRVLLVFFSVFCDTQYLKSVCIKILQLSDNPGARNETIKKVALERLKAENEALLEQIFKIRGNGHRPKDAHCDICIPTESYRSLESANLSLKEEAENANKQLERLKSVYTTKAQEYREVVLRLVGYKLDVGTDGTISLQSMHHISRDQDTTIIFANIEEPSPRVQVLWAPEDLKEYISTASDRYLGHNANIPCFLAHLTLEFSKSSDTSLRLQ